MLFCNWNANSDFLRFFSGNHFLEGGFFFSISGKGGGGVFLRWGASFLSRGMPYGGIGFDEGGFSKKIVGWGWAIQSLVPGFGVIGDSDRDLILGDCLLSIMTKKHIIIKGCSTSYEWGRTGGGGGGERGLNHGDIGFLIHRFPI